jgi:hypothetical protein
VEEQPNHVLVVMAEPEKLNPMPAVVIELAVENPIPGPSHEPQPSVAIEVKAPTVTASKSTHRRKLKTRSNSNTTQRGIDRVEPKATQNHSIVAIECPDFADAQTLPYFYINDTNLSERIIDFMEIRILGLPYARNFKKPFFHCRTNVNELQQNHRLLLMIMCITCQVMKYRLYKTPALQIFLLLWLLKNSLLLLKKRKGKPLLLFLHYLGGELGQRGLLEQQLDGSIWNKKYSFFIHYPLLLKT